MGAGKSTIGKQLAAILKLEFLDSDAEIQRRTGVDIEYCPVLIGGVFKATNNVSPMVSLQGIKNKPEYQEIETQRFLKRHGITSYRRNPHFPVNTLAIMRGAVC